MPHVKKDRSGEQIHIPACMWAKYERKSHSNVPEAFSAELPFAFSIATLSVSAVDSMSISTSSSFCCSSDMSSLSNSSAP